MDHAIFEQSLLIEINNQLKSLKNNESAVIKMYFGLDREHAMALNEIGEKLNLTRERVRQIKEKALAKLAHSQRIKILEPLYNEVLTRTEQPFYNQSIGGWLLDPYMNYTKKDEDSILMLEEYIKGSKRVQFIKGIHNLTKHYQSLIPSILNKIGHITLKKNIIKRIKFIDGMFNSTIFDYSIRTSKNIKIVNDYIGLIKHFEGDDG
jgi:hypothetical protein